MTTRDREKVPEDALLARLRTLPSARLDDVAAARTLARAEAALTPGRPSSLGWFWSPGWLLSAALVGWGMLYAWGAVGALARLFPTRPPVANALTAPAPAPCLAVGHGVGGPKID